MKRTIFIVFITFSLFFTMVSLYSGMKETLKITALFENNDITGWTAYLKKGKTILNKEINYDSSKKAYTATFEITFTASFSGSITLNVNNSDGIPVDFIYPGKKKKRIEKQYFRLSYIHMLTENPNYFLSADGRVYREKESSIKKFLLETAIVDPVISPAGGTYFNNLEVGITTESDADIVYTTGGKNPEAEYILGEGGWKIRIIEGTAYTEKIKVTENNTTIISQVYKRGLKASKLVTAVYKLNVSKLKIEPAGFNSKKPIEVVIKMTEQITKDAKIIYTIDGTEPTLSNGIEYTEKIKLTETTTIRAKAFKDGYLPAEEVSATFTINESQ